jgi:hypothetical protein
MQDVRRLATQIAAPVDRRLRMLVLLERKPLGEVLTLLLDRHLPPAEELAGMLATEKVAS